MADGVKGAVSDVREAVVKPVVDEVGKAIEQGVQSVTGKTPQNVGPQQKQPFDSAQGKLEDAGKLTEARRKIKFWQDLEVAQKQVREKQKSLDTASDKQQQEKMKVRQFEVVNKKKQNSSLREAQRKTEMKKGVGG